MQLLNFGKSHLTISRIGLGLAALGRPGYINLGHAEDYSDGNSKASMKQRAEEILTLAKNSGVRYFDTARSYGLGEEFLGNWMKVQTDKNNLVIGSKWGYTYTADWKVKANVHEVKEHSLSVLKRQWHESELCLHRRPDIYHIHSATLESGVLDKEEVLNYLFELKSKGTIIGLSLSGPEQAHTLAKAIEIEYDGDLLFGSVQATYNLLEPSVENLLIKASSQGWGIIAKEVLANGRLTTRNKNTGNPAMQLLKELSVKYEASIDALAMAYVLTKPWISIVLSGAATSQQLKSNLASLEISLDAADVERIAAVHETAEVYWRTRSQLDWN